MGDVRKTSFGQKQLKGIDKFEDPDTVAEQY